MSPSLYPLLPPAAWPDLPLSPRLPELAALARRERGWLLSAEPGAGKTTLVPLALAAQEPGRILVTEPRRLAVLAAARRLSDLAGTPLGREIGYRMRGDTRSEARTKIEVITPGVLLRLLQDDPGLEGVSLILLDEFHERGADQDLAWAFLRDLKDLRPELGLGLMSATLEAQRLASELGWPVFEAPGRAYPVETRYAPLPDQNWEAPLARRLSELVARTEGQVLVFVPGRREMDRVASGLREALPAANWEILTLHGQGSWEAQRRALDPPTPGQRRVTIATNIAESSLTLPGIRVVADAGWTRVSEFVPQVGLNRLVTERVSQAAAEQRRGRAGRLGPGLCWRFWPENLSLELQPRPELLRTDLAGPVLEAALWGARQTSDLRWLDPPPPGPWQEAQRRLQFWGALDAEGRPTERGRRLARLGLEPALGHMLLSAEALGAAWQGAALAALAEDERPPPGVWNVETDYERLQRQAPQDPWVQERAQAQRRLFERLGSPGLSSAEAPAPGALLAQAWPDRLALLDPEGRTAYLPGGRQLRLKEPQPGRFALSVFDAEAGGRIGTVYRAWLLSEAEAGPVVNQLAKEEREPEWRDEGLRVWVSRRWGGLELSRRPGTLEAGEAKTAALARLKTLPPEAWPWPEEALRTLARLRWAAGPEETARWSEKTLQDELELWLGPFIAEKTGAVPSHAWQQALAARWGFDQRWKDLAPDHWPLPSGRRVPLHYSPEGRQCGCEAKVQEWFGCREHPRLGGRPLVLTLLGPAGRPLQVTSDLPGFWRGAWAETRKDLRGRYPKHFWPEDPATSEATKGPKPRPH